MPQDQMVSSPLMSFPSWNSGVGQNEEVVSSSQSLGAPFGANTGMHLGSSFSLEVMFLKPIEDLVPVLLYHKNQIKEEYPLIHFSR